jgi:hypothetical protein
MKKYFTQFMERDIAFKIASTATIFSAVTYLFLAFKNAGVATTLLNASNIQFPVALFVLYGFISVTSVAVSVYSLYTLRQILKIE